MCLEYRQTKDSIQCCRAHARPCRRRWRVRSLLNFSHPTSGSAPPLVSCEASEDKKVSDNVTDISTGTHSQMLKQTRRFFHKHRYRLSRKVPSCAQRVFLDFGLNFAKALVRLGRANSLADTVDMSTECHIFAGRFGS